MIRYRANAAPVTGYLCHCHLCQKRSGSAFSFQLVFPAGSVELTQGEPLRREKVQSDGGTSVSLWCPECYSRLWMEYDRSPFATVRAGTLDDTANLRPAAQIFTSSAQSWAIEPDILTYQEWPPSWDEMVEAGREIYAAIL
jgi:hypothetical protein